MTDDLQKPLVSIVVPAFNAGEYLREAIDSILNQSYPNIELIVLDDGSTDNTKEILQSYPEDAFYWESHSNMGQSATLNKGWKMAKGKVLSYLSADDALMSNAVSHSVECLFKHKNIIMTYCDYMLMDSHSKDIQHVRAPDFEYQKMVSEIVVQPGPGVFFLKAAFENAGGWNTNLRQVPDFEYWLRLGLLGDFYRIPKLLARFRVHEDSQTFAESSIEKAEECVQVMNDYFCSTDIPAEIKVLENVSKSHAYMYVARLHLRAGRYRMMYKNLKEAHAISSASLFSFRMVRLLGNGLLFRIKRLLK